jgi:GNAT superfamily N-acetyltransferase
MIYKKLTVNDANDIAKLHYEAFKDFFLTSLGKRFLTIFYQAVLTHPNGLGIGVYDEDNQFSGFAVGTLNNAGFYSSIIKNKWLALGWAAIPAIIMSPGKLKRLLTSIIATKTTGSNDTYIELPSLLSICIKPGKHSKGIGTILINNFEKQILSKGLFELTLTTDASNNEYTNSFYQKNDYVCVKSFFQGEREMNLYYKELKK